MQKLIFLLGCAILILQWACSQPDCEDEYILDKIHIYAYSLENANDIVIVGYAKDSDFQIVEQTFTVTGFRPCETHEGMIDVFFDSPLNPGFDYQLTFTTLGLIKNITGIQVYESICFDGIFGNEYVHRFDGYLIDGFPYSGQVIAVSP